MPAGGRTGSNQLEPDAEGAVTKNSLDFGGDEQAPELRLRTMIPASPNFIYQSNYLKNTSL